MAEDFSGLTAVRSSGPVARCLDGRAGDRTVGTKDAAVALGGLQHHTAPLAVIEIPAGVGRHGLDLPVSALGAGNGRLKLDHDDARLFHSAKPVRPRKKNSAGKRT